MLKEPNFYIAKKKTMNSALIPLDTYIQSLGLKHKTYADLSKNSSGSSLVSFTLKEAYCFDELVNNLFVICPHSVDALLLRNNLYFIEFKSVANVTNRKEKENIKQNLELKLTDSALIFYKELCEPLSLNLTSFKRIAIIVVDYRIFPVSAMSGVLTSLSGGASAANITVSNFRYYASPDKNGEYVFYHDVQIWNNINFQIQIMFAS